jgi:hypothetical protein
LSISTIEVADVGHQDGDLAPLAAELELAGLHELLGHLAADDPRQGAHQLALLGHVLDDQHRA